MARAGGGSDVGFQWKWWWGLLVLVMAVVMAITLMAWQFSHRDHSICP